ncbi:unnamed protein product [Calypogeia fissa]
MPAAAPEQAGGMEDLMNTVLSSSELRDAVFRLNVETDLSSRTKMLKEICGRASGSSAALRTIGEALTRYHSCIGNLPVLFNVWTLTAGWTCWRDQRYSGSELSEWRTCIIEAADLPAKVSKGHPEVFILYTKLAAKVCKWCAQIVIVDFQESLFNSDSLAQVPKTLQVVIRLTSTVFEAVADEYMSGQTILLEEPVASALERSTLNAFELVSLIYVSLMKKSSSQAADDDMLRKSCQELLGVTHRLVRLFRRQVGSKATEAHDNNSQQESSPGSRWANLPTALRIVASSIQSFVELGKLSTSSGETSLALLNISWKSILALLQVEEGREVVASVVDIPSIIITLISNAVDSTKRAMETWIVKSSDSGQKEARKLCIPIKFFLLTAQKISAVYPQKAAMATRNIISCASKVVACLLQKDLIAHKATTEAFAEHVVPSAFSLLQNLLNDPSLQEDLKIQILRDITTDSDELEVSQAVTDLDGGVEGNDIVDELFCNKPSSSPGAGLLRTGRVVLFISLLRASGSYNKALLHELLTKLRWLLEEIPEEGMYVLMTQIIYLPVDRSDMSGKWKWQLMFSWVSHAIEIFAVVLAKQEPIWAEFKYFLFDEVLHPSVMCGELLLNVWCFIIRQSDPEIARDHVESLLFILRRLVRIEEEEALQRRVARAICVLLQAAPDSVASQVCKSNPFKSDDDDAYMIMQLLQEGLPLSKAVSDSLLSNCIACLKGLGESLKMASRGRSAGLYVPKHALICLSLLISQSACRGESIEDKYLEEIKQIVRHLISSYTLDHNYSRMLHNEGVIAPTLELIPHVLHLLDPTILEELLPRLLEVCLTTPGSSSSKELKQSLPEFLANLSAPEDESNPAMKALWGLYHLALRQKPWALMHMGLQSFAHFAAHTSCQELWRFVPQDAAIVSNGNGDDDFMTSLKVFIEKECALLSLTSTGEELRMLRTESNLQQQKHKRTLSALRKQKHVEMNARFQKSTKPSTKPPSGTSDIQEAVAMLCKGIGVLKERVPEMLKGEASQEWEAIRARLAEMNEQVKAFQRGDR